MPREFSAVLVKGRGNYVSLRRLALAKERQGSLFQYDEEVAELEGLLEWSEETRDGSLSDLPTIPRASVWDEVHSDSGNCMGRACPRYNDCHYFAARRRMNNAQVLVVNHALFFSDLALRRVEQVFFQSTTLLFLMKHIWSSQSQVIILVSGCRVSQLSDFFHDFTTSEQIVVYLCTIN
jgi:hypothetical protein